jgi:hypothetical protein
MYKTPPKHFRAGLTPSCPISHLLKVIHLSAFLLKLLYLSKRVRGHSQRHPAADHLSLPNALEPIPHSQRRICLLGPDRPIGWFTPVDVSADAGIDYGFKTAFNNQVIEVDVYGA